MSDMLAKATGFQWDAGNVRKNWERHRVSTMECEQTFFNRPLVAARDAAHSQNEPRFYALGRTDARRQLFIAFTIREEEIRVISARPMSRPERSVYQQTTEEEINDQGD